MNRLRMIEDESIEIHLKLGTYKVKMIYVIFTSFLDRVTKSFRKEEKKRIETFKLHLEKLQQSRCM